MKLGVLAIARPTFDVAFAQETADAALANLRQAGLEIVGQSQLAMDADAVEEALAGLTGIDALVILQATFADSSLAILATKADVPLLLWAFPEDRTGGRLRLNSFCGINLAGYALTNLEKEYRWVYQSAEDPTAPGEIESKIRTAADRPPITPIQNFDQFRPAMRHAAETVRERLATTTIGRVGNRPDGFEPCDYEANILSDLLGVTVDEIPLDELFARAEAAEPDRVAHARTRATAVLDGIADVDQVALDRSLRLNAGLKSLIDDASWAGVATRCWPETFTEFGGAACTPMGLLAGDGTPGTCEADVYGNITGLILQWFADQPPFIADLVHLDTETNTGVFWHCGLAPFDMADPEAVAVATVHSNRHKPLLSEFPLKPGRVTLARLSQSRGQHRLVIGTGDMVRAPLAFSGTAGVVHFDRPVADVTATVLDEGLEHHFGIVYADIVDKLHSLASLLGLPVVTL